MFILSFFLFFGTSVPLKISHLTALLQFKDPQSQKASQFTISAEGGCFQWTSLNPNIVHIIPHYQSENCSNSATVEAVATGPIRRSTAIIAESNAGILKCDVFVDSVRKISIVTTTRTIYNESSLETLSLVAMDSENNTFTSLEGADVKWYIDEEHLRKVSKEKAKLFLPKNTSFKSSSLIIQGKKVGKTWAKATLNGIHNAYVDLNVVKAIGFLPFPVIRTLPFHYIPFELCSSRDSGVINQKSRQNATPIGITVDQKHISRVEFDSSYCISSIQLPSNSYEITTSNPNTMTANESGFAITHEPGESVITATDISIRDNKASTLVYVMYPSKEKSDIPPQWIALGDDPVFNPILRDNEGRPLDIFGPIDWVIQGEWKTVGTKRIKLIYHSFSLDAIVYVCPPISMDPPEAVLPTHYKDFRITPVGGSGEYEFVVDETSVLSYRDYKVQTFQEGRTKIYVRDKRIRKYKNFSDIIVSKVSHVDIQLEKRELLINSYFEPKCDVYAIGNRRFSVKMTPRTFSIKHDIVSSDMKSLQPGFSEIYCEAGYEPVKSDKILVSVADELYAQVKGRGAPNSAIPLIVSGGVRQWPGSQSATVNVSCGNANVINHPNNTFFIDREYYGFCTAMMQNRKTDLNPFPIKLLKDFWLNISNVHHFDLYALDVKASLNKKCNVPPRRISYNDVINERYKDFIRAYRIVAGHDHRLLVFPRDVRGNIINHYSGVRFSVQTSLGEQLNQKNLKHGLLGETEFSYKPSKSVDITVISQDLNPTITSFNEIKPMELSSPQIIYYIKNKNYKFQIEDGSGYFTTECKNASFNNGILNYSPVKPGMELIPINDSCTDHTIRYLNVTAVSVETLEIIAPKCVFVNTEFDAKVKAYGQRSIPLPYNLLHEASIILRANWSKQVGEDLWHLRPTKTGKLVLTATAENNVTKKAIVEVIESLIITPQYIEILPGESELITIISGPSNSDDVFFESEDTFIAKVVRKIKGFYVYGVSPGNITINAYINHDELKREMDPYKIHVHVLRPISLLVEPSTYSPIQTGYVGLRLLVLTNNGYRIPKEAEWNWKIQQSETNGYSYVQINKSFAFVNLSSQLVPLSRSNISDVIVEIKAFNNLETEYIAQVEPKLIITTPRLIILPPYCSYRIGILNYKNINVMQDCIFKPENESIVTCYDGLIKSYSVEGETTVNVIYGHQKLTVNVRVSNPAFLYIDMKYSDANIMLLDPYGLLYSSVDGVRYSLTCLKDCEVYETDSKGHYHVKKNDNSIDLFEFHASAINPEFHLETSRNISINTKIIPSSAFIVKRATLNFQCTAFNPRWSVSDSSILSINQAGAATGLRRGNAKVYCDGKYAKVTVTEFTNIKLIDETNDLFRVDKVFNPPVTQNDDDFVLQEPRDLVYECVFEETSCAVVEKIQDQTGIFCKLNRIRINNTYNNDDDDDIYVKCSSEAKIKVYASSESAQLSLYAEAPVSSSYYYFGNSSYNKYNFSDAFPNIKIDGFGGDESNYTIKKPKNVRILWRKGGITIMPDESFRSTAKIVFIYKKSRVVYTTIEIEYIHSEDTGRKFDINDDAKFIIVLIAMFLGISYIIFLLTESD